MSSNLQTVFVASLLLLPLTGLALVQLWPRSFSRVSGLWWLTPLIPAGLVTFVLMLSADRFGDYVLEVAGLRFQYDAVVNRPVTVGGDSDRDHFHVRGLPPRFLQVVPQPGGVQVVRNGGVGGKTQDTVGPHSFGLVRMTVHDPDRLGGEPRAGAAGGLVGAYDISTARRVELQIGADRFIIEPARRKVWLETGPSVTFTVPTRRTAFSLPYVPLEFDLPVLRELGPELRIHSFRAIGRELKGLAPLQNGTAGAPADAIGSFLYFDGGYFRNRLHVMLLDPGADLKIDGQSHQLDHRATLIALKPGQSAHFRLYRIDYAEGRGIHLRSRIQERRSFDLRVSQAEFRFLLDTPFLLRIGQDQIIMRPDDDAKTEPRRFTIIGEPFAADLPFRQSLLRLPMVGSSYGPELFSQIMFQERTASPTVVTHQGVVAPDLGQSFFIGDRDAVELRIDQQKWPAGTIVFVWLVALANLVLLLGSTSRKNRFVLASLVFIEAMLALRLLIAIATTQLDPLVQDQRMALVYAAYAAVPFLFDRSFAAYLEGGVISVRSRIRTAFVPGLALAVLIAYPAMVFATGYRSFPHLLAFAGMFFIFLILTPHIVDLGRWLSARVSRLGVARLVPLRRIGWLSLGLIALFLLSRCVIMVAFGWKERISLGGQQVAISVFYTPLLMLAVSVAMAYGHRIPPGPLVVKLARRFKRTFGSARWIARSLIATLVVLIGAGFVPALVRDIGIMFLYVLAIASTAALIGSRGTRSSALAVAAVLPLALSILMLTLLPTYKDIVRLTGVELSTPPVEVDQLNRDRAIAYVRQQLSADHNSLRLWNIMAPERLKEIGTESAENLLVVMKTMERYVNSGWFGKGYLGVDLAPQLRATQANDNVSAIHIIAPFGALGGIALMGVTLAWFLSLATPALRPGRPGAQGLRPIRTSFGMLCATTIVSATAYMILANLNVVPFTGKNVYFLAALSVSDIVEGTLLVGLATWAFVRP